MVFRRRSIGETGVKQFQNVESLLFFFLFFSSPKKANPSEECWPRSSSSSSSSFSFLVLLGQFSSPSSPPVGRIELGNFYYQHSPTFFHPFFRLQRKMAALVEIFTKYAYYLLSWHAYKIVQISDSVLYSEKTQLYLILSIVRSSNPCLFLLSVSLLLLVPLPV